MIILFHSMAFATCPFKTIFLSCGDSGPDFFFSMFQQRNSFEPCKSKDRLHCHHICAVSNYVNIKSIIIAKRINTGSHPGGVNVTVSKNRPSQSAQWAGRARRSKSTLHFVHKSGNMTQFVLRFIISISRLAEIPLILPCRCGATLGYHRSIPNSAKNSHFVSFTSPTVDISHLHPDIFFLFCPFLSSLGSKYGLASSPAIP